MLNLEPKPELIEELKIVWDKGEGTKVVLHQKIHKKQTKCWVNYVLLINDPVVLICKSLPYTAHEAFKLAAARQLLAEVDSKPYWKKEL